MRTQKNNAVKKNNFKITKIYIPFFSISNKTQKHYLKKNTHLNTKNVQSAESFHASLKSQVHVNSVLNFTVVYMAREKQCPYAILARNKNGWGVHYGKREVGIYL